MERLAELRLKKLNKLRTMIN